MKVITGTRSLLVGTICACLFWHAHARAVVPQGVATDGPRYGIAGMAVLSPQSTLVWSETAGAFELWRVDLSSADPQWQREPVPQEVTDAKARMRGDAWSIGVNVAPDGGIRLLWVDGALHQALSQDRGRTWRIDATTLTTGRIMPFFNLCMMADADAGWLVLHDDGGTGHMPQVLLRTTNGGREWQSVASPMSPRNLSTGVLDGGLFHLLRGSGSQLSVLADARVTSFDMDRHQLIGATTDNGGQTWTSTVLADGHHHVSDSRVLPRDPARPDRVCVDLQLDDVVDTTRPHRDGRYCSSDLGRSWTSPTPIPRPHATPREGADRRTLPVYAETNRAWALVRTSDGHRVYRTTDTGRSWSVDDALTKRYATTSESVRIDQVAVQGASLWLLAMIEGSPMHGDLLHSADGGSTWRVLTPVSPALPTISR